MDRDRLGRKSIAPEALALLEESVRTTDELPAVGNYCDRRGKYAPSELLHPVLSPPPKRCSERTVAGDPQSLCLVVVR
jgi:hypothetical protein